MEDLKEKRFRLQREHERISEELIAVDQKLNDKRYKKVVGCKIMSKLKWGLQHPPLGASNDFIGLYLTACDDRKKTDEYIEKFCRAAGDGHYHVHFQVGEYIEIRVDDSDVNLSITLFNIDDEKRKEKMSQLVKDFGINIVDDMQTKKIKERTKSLEQSKKDLEITQDFIAGLR